MTLAPDLAQLGTLARISEDVDQILDVISKASEYGVEGNSQLVGVPVSTAPPNDVDLGSYKSILLFNEGTVDVYVGFGNDTGIAGRRAFTLRASSWIAVPYRGNMVSLGSTGAATTVAVVPLSVPLLTGAGGGGGSGSFSGALTGPFGRLADAASVATALSTEDVALLTSLATKLDALHTDLTTGVVHVAAAVGYTGYSFLSTAAVQAVNLKASAAVLTKLTFFKIAAGRAFVRVYDKATAPLTTDTPIWRGVIPGSTAGDAGGYTELFPDGLPTLLGLGLRVTGAVADNDATALAANDVIGGAAFL